MSKWTRRDFLHRAMLGSAGVLCATGAARVAHAKMAPDASEMRFARRLFPEGDPTTVRMVGFDPEVAFGAFEAYRDVMGRGRGKAGVCAGEAGGEHGEPLPLHLQPVLDACGV